jgi:cobalt transporter subunit CbtB
MTTTTTAPVGTQTGSTVMAILAAAFIGLGLIFVAGHLQAETLHDAAHDVRHATGFPCH